MDDATLEYEARIEALVRQNTLLQDENKVFKGEKRLGIKLASAVLGFGVLGAVGQLLVGFGRSIWPLPCDFCSDTVTKRYLLVLGALAVVTVAQVPQIVILTDVFNRGAAAPTPTPTPAAPTPAAPTPAALTPAAPTVQYNPVPPAYATPAESYQFRAL